RTSRDTRACTCIRPTRRARQATRSPRLWLARLNACADGRLLQGIASIAGWSPGSAGLVTPPPTLGAAAAFATGLGGGADCRWEPRAGRGPVLRSDLACIGLDFVKEQNTNMR